MQTVLKDAEARMKKALAALDKEFSRLRTGRATTSLLDGVRVDYYGTPTQLDQLASVATPDSRTITIQPWDRKAFADIEKAILKSGLGLTPVNDGKVIRISPRTRPLRFGPWNSKARPSSRAPRSTACTTRTRPNMPTP